MPFGIDDEFHVKGGILSPLQWNIIVSDLIDTLNQAYMRMISRF